MHRLFSVLLIVLFLAAGFLLGISNPQSVPFQFFVTTTEWPLSVLLALSFVLGALLSALYMWLGIARLRWTNQRLTHQLQQQGRERLQWQTQQQSDRKQVTRQHIHQALEDAKEPVSSAPTLPASATSDSEKPH